MFVKVLRLALTGRKPRKHLFHISTIGVANGATEQVKALGQTSIGDNFLTAQAPLGEISRAVRRFSGGYNLSKVGGRECCTFDLIYPDVLRTTNSG